MISGIVRTGSSFGVCHIKSSGCSKGHFPRYIRVMRGAASDIAADRCHLYPRTRTSAFVRRVTVTGTPACRHSTDYMEVPVDAEVPARDVAAIPLWDSAYDASNLKDKPNLWGDPPVP